jgi:hypothetical protein
MIVPGRQMPTGAATMHMGATLYGGHVPHCCIVRAHHMKYHMGRTLMAP